MSCVKSSTPQRRARAGGGGPRRPRARPEAPAAPEPARRRPQRARPPGRFKGGENRSPRTWREEDGLSPPNVASFTRARPGAAIRGRPQPGRRQLAAVPAQAAGRGRSDAQGARAVAALDARLLPSTRGVAAGRASPRGVGSPNPRVAGPSGRPPARSSAAQPLAVRVHHCARTPGDLLADRTGGPKAPASRGRGGPVGGPSSGEPGPIGPVGGPSGRQPRPIGPVGGPSSREARPIDHVCDRSGRQPRAIALRGRRR
jgi:hypothetical protein